MTRSLVPAWLIASAALAAAPLNQAQQQSSGARAGWPCGARLDPSYFEVAERTGGHLLLLAPAEVGDSAALLTTFTDHPQTIFRLAGTINPGLHEFRIPIDSTVESVVFSVAVQCLQAAEIVRPSGAPVAGGDGVIDLSSFQAERMISVKRPEPGVWIVRAAGSGVAGLVVQARTPLSIAQVQFAAAGGSAFTSTPLPDIENAVRIVIGGPAGEVRASLVDGAARRIAALPLTAGDTPNTYVSRVAPGVDRFRVMVEGKDAAGLPFQRVSAPLFAAYR